jgi:hypothetical protein
MGRRLLLPVSRDTLLRVVRRHRWDRTGAIVGIDDFPGSWLGNETA